MADDHESSEMLVEVDNQIGASKGQQVSLKMEGKSLVFSALLVYIFPLFSMILGYFSGSYLIPVENELSGILGALIFLAISFLVIRVVSARTAIQPKVTRVISKPTDNNKFNCH
jgi:sigma-E factor negative regulatory protein RseC